MRICLQPPTKLAIFTQPSYSGASHLPSALMPWSIKPTRATLRTRHICTTDCIVMDACFCGIRHETWSKRPISEAAGRLPLSSICNFITPDVHVAAHSEWIVHGLDAKDHRQQK